MTKNKDADKVEAATVEPGATKIAQRQARVAQQSEDDAAIASSGIAHMDLLRANMAQASRQRRIDAGEEVEPAEELEAGQGQLKPENYAGKHGDLLLPEGVEHPNERPVQPIGSTKDLLGRELVQMNSPRIPDWTPNDPDALKGAGSKPRDARATEPAGSGVNEEGERPVQPIGSTEDILGRPLVNADTPRTDLQDTVGREPPKRVVDERPAAGGASVAVSAPSATAAAPAPAKPAVAPAKPAAPAATGTALPPKRKAKK